MDRTRELGNSRRGSLTGAPIPAPRRPRSSGFKDVAGAACEDSPVDAQNARFHDQSRKESHGLSNTASSVARSRTRNMLRELHLHSRTANPEETDETTEDVDMIGSEEEDLIVIPHRMGKLRLQAKMSDKGNAVDLPAVPRKARTALVKRSPEFLLTSVGEKAKAAVGTSSSLSSASVSKPAKRLKPNGTKPWTSKPSKVSMATLISEQEVEVAAALFDLSRMVPNQASPSHGNGRPEVKIEAMPVSSPVKSMSSAQGDLCSSPAMILTASAEAPKRKHPRIRTKMEDGLSGPALAMSALESRGGIDQKAEGAGSHTQNVAELIERAKADAKAQNDSDHLSSPTSLAVSPSEVSGQCVPNPKNEVSGQCALNPNDNGLMEEKSSLDSNACACQGRELAKLAKPASLSMEDKSLVVPVSNMLVNTDSLSLDAMSEAKHTHHVSGEELKATDHPATPEIENSLSRLQTSAGHNCKNEIDLMAPPDASAICTTETTGNNLVSVGLELNEKAQDPVSHLTQVKGTTLDEQDPKHERDDVVKNSGKELVSLENYSEKVPETGKTCLSKKEVDPVIMVDTEADKQDEKAEVSEHSCLQPGKNVMADSTLQQAADEAGLIDLKIAPSESKFSMRLSSPLAAAAVTGWPGSGGPSHMGYYSPAAAAAAVAAAWAPRSKMPSGKENHHTASQGFSFALAGAHPSCKHCATHVYIAHFIDAQQQLQKHPLWAATYANAASSLYSMKCYNLTASAPLPGSNNKTNQGSDLAVGEKNFSLPGPKEKVSVDRKQLLQQQAQTTPQQMLFPSQAGLAPVFGYPVTQASASSICNTVPVSGFATAGGNVSGSSSAAAGTSAVSSCPEAVTGPAGSTSNGCAGNAAAAQMQFMQAIMQQAGFPFPFSPGHFVPPPSHIIQQQGTTGSSNPFYNHPFSHPALQQPPAVAGRALSEMQAHSQQGAHLTQVSSQDFNPNGAMGGKQLDSTKLPSQLNQSCKQAQPATASIRKQRHSISHHQSAQSTLSLCSKGLDAQAFPGMSILGPGPLGLVPVAGVMASQGHAVMQMKPESKHFYATEQPCQQSLYSLGAKAIETTESHSIVKSILDSADKRPAKQMNAADCSSRKDMQAFGGTEISGGGGQHQAPIQQNTAASLTRNLRQFGPAPAASASTSAYSASSKDARGQTKALPLLEVAESDSMSSTLSDRGVGVPLGVPFADQNYSQSIKHGQSLVQLAKPVLEAQLGTISASTASCPLLSGTVPKQQVLAARCQEASLTMMQSRSLPSVSGTFESGPVPSSSNSSVMKNTPPGKSSSSQRLAMNSGKKSSVVSPQLSGSILGPSSTTVVLGQSQVQRHQHQTQGQQQHYQIHQYQQFPQSLQQQMHLFSGSPSVTSQYHQSQMTSQITSQGSPSVTLQYHQPQMTSQATSQGSPSVTLQCHQPQMTSQATSQGSPSVTLQYHQPQMTSQGYAKHSVQQQSSNNHQLQHSLQQAICHSMQQHQQHDPQQQLGKNQFPLVQAVFSQQPPVVRSSEVSVHTSQMLAHGTIHGGRSSSSDGVPDKVLGDSSFTPRKSLGSSAGSSSAPTLRVIDRPPLIASDSQTATPAGSRSSTELLQTSSVNTSFLHPQSVTISSSSATAGKMEERTFPGQLHQTASGQTFSYLSGYTSQQNGVLTMNAKGQQANISAGDLAFVPSQKGASLQVNPPVSSGPSNAQSSSLSQVSADPKTLGMQQGVLSNPQHVTAAHQMIEASSASAVASGGGSAGVSVVRSEPANILSLESKGV